MYQRQMRKTTEQRGKHVEVGYEIFGKVFIDEVDVSKYNSLDGKSDEG